MNEITKENEKIENMIYEVRGLQVMLSTDVAKLYKTETRIINQKIKRNIMRFLKSFCFQLTMKEMTDLKSQNVISSLKNELTHGGTIFGGKLDRLYSTIVPDKKYAGYDTTNYKSIYKDDIDDYVQKSEIIIGKNINNVKNRKEIEELEIKYSKYIPIEMIAILVLSLLMILVGKLL